ncbi:prepilin peptidase [uncultured Tessaracoccus sp.]|uniref:prepilin peptidase n=1 Tax=uncultured Tessaracoccus sp. TaxID=905023 RepID=UPI00262046D2|nr:prepilin peptidase [uncultured Tessaracoccus sp.]
MWEVVAIATAFVVAVWVQCIVVPTLRQPHVDDGDETPDFTGLGSASNVLLVLVCAALGGLAAWHTSTPAWPWLGYIALGAPLVVVDLRTTYLPNQLMYPLWATIGVGLAVSATTDVRGAIAGVTGALAGYTWFWCVWRLSSTFGFGDVRLAAAAGAIAGMSGMTGWLTSLVVATAIGAVAAIIARASGRTVVPYGPWLWLGPVVAAWLPTGS